MAAACPFGADRDGRWLHVLTSGCEVCSDALHDEDAQTAAELLGPQSQRSIRQTWQIAIGAIVLGTLWLLALGAWLLERTAGWW